MNPIIAEIARRGRISFAEFMELALYHPQHGYYTRPRAGAGPAGAHGDFLTAPTAAPLFAATLARLVGALALELGEAVTFAELGAGEGFLLARLGWARGEKRRQTLGRIVAIEAAPWARERVGERVPGVEVAGRLADLPRPHGAVVLFASELYDALPCHRVTMRRRGEMLELAELFVEAGEGEALRWALGPPGSPSLEAYLAGHGVTLEEDQVAELRPEVSSLHAEHLAWCSKNALAIIVDYGYPARQLYNPRGRRAGSVAGYWRHELITDVLQQPGEIDITAHLNFDDLETAAARVGWERGELRPLGAFLALHGALSELEATPDGEAPLTAQQWADLAAAKRLLLPAGMGADLKVLVQGRGGAWHAYRGLATPPPLGA
ncbi:MAG: SAM-dependent methyltransferase [Acidobacteriota bacterium]